MKRSELHFCKPNMDASVLLKSCSNGVSELVSQCSAAVTTFLFNVTMMKLLGEDGVAAITVLIYSQFFLTTLTIGFSMGTAPVVSYNYGSGNVKQLKKTVRICFSFIAGISIFVFLFSLLAGESIAKVFAENNRNGFSIFSFSFVFSGCNIFSSALFTALSNGKASATISFLRTFGFITVSLLVLPRFLEVTGVWLAVPFAELFTLMLTVYLICRHRKQYNYFWKKGRQEIETDRMDIMPCLREQNPQQNQGGYYSDKLSSLLPEMQAGKIDRSEKFTNNSHHRARHNRCRADERVSNHSLSAFLFI